MESQTQFFYTESLVAYIVLQCRLSKSLLSLWSRFSCSYTESQRWARILGFAFPRSRVPALPRSRVLCILGTRARGNANFVQERGNMERERIGMLISRSCGEI